MHIYSSRDDQVPNLFNAATMILAVMSRASLAHTVRPLVVGGPATAAYCLIALVTIVRVLAALAVGAQ